MPDGMTADAADAFLGPEPKQSTFSPQDAEAFLGPDPGAGHPGGVVPGGNPERDGDFARSGAGYVAGQFKQGMQDGFGTADLGLSDDMTAYLKKAGIFNDASKGQTSIIRAFNEALIRPAAAALDAAIRVPGALYSGAQEAVKAAGEAVGQPDLGRDIATLPDAFAGGLPEVPHPPAVARAIDLPAARDLGVIGQPESVWKGTAEPVPTPPAAVNENVRGAQMAAAEAPPAPPEAAVASPPTPEPEAAPEPAAPTDVHGLARQIAPDTFKEYDALAAHQDTLRQAIADQTADLQKQAEAQAPHQAEIADLEARMQDTTPRLAKKYQARLDALTPERDAFLQNEDGMALITRDTPEVTALRQQLLETDFRMRDLAPDVSDAYRQAAEQMPAPEEPAAPSVEEAAAARTPEPVEQPAVAEPVKAAEEVPPQPGAAPAAEPAKPAAPAPVADIAADVSTKLRAAGRPVEEADAAGQVTKALWQTRADAFDGKKGTAEEMYSREAPDIRAGKQARQMEMAQERAGGVQGKIKLATDGRAVITLMKNADASTFLHETGHDWLERMMADAQDPAAPQHMRDDAATVRAYIGAKEGEPIPIKAHEKFARSFERYFMEGRAPSAKLAGVFGQFKDWLTNIYQTVAKLRAPITPDIRDVFDRLLTSDREAAIVPDEARGPKPEPQTRSFPPESKTPLYDKAKEPERLASWLRRQGGVIDEGGNIKAMLGGAKYRPGLISKTGMNLDDATRSAWEAGYFPEHGDRRPMINDLLDALEGDVKGHAPRYSDAEQDRVTAYHEALATNNEIDRLAHEHGIDTKGKTREQFFDEVTAKLSPEAVKAEVAKQDAAHSEQFDEAAAEAKAWAEGHNIDYNSDEFYGINGPRSLEDLESGFGQENAARPAGQGDADGADAAAAAGREGHSEAGGGPRGGIPGAASRVAQETDAGAGGSAGGERTAGPGDTASPATPFSRSDDGLIDKAGNIRLDNLNQPEDVNAVIRETATQNDDFQTARRGVVSDAQVLDLADALGMRPQDLNARKIGEAFNAEQVMAARKLLIESAQSVRDAMAKAANGSDADVMAYAEARQRHLMIQEQVSGITAEAGRALRAFRSIGQEGEQTKALGDFLQVATGRTLNQMRREARAGMLLETPQQVSKYLQDSAKPTFGDMALEYWINGLISGPATHTTYAIGNAMLAVWKAVPETAVASAIGAIRRGLGDEGARVYAGEVQAQLYALMKGQRDGVRAAWKAAKTGLTTELPGEGEAGAQASFLAQQTPRTAIPGVVGQVVRLPSRGVATIHSYFRAIGYEQSIAQLAYRQALTEGLDDTAMSARVADLTANPPPEMMEAARAAATDQTLMNSGGPITQKVADLINTPIVKGFPLLKLIDPFVKIGSNVMSQALMERSPLGLLDQGIRENLMGKNGPIARDNQMARISVGSALGATVVGLAAQGMITGGGPTDPKQAAMWKLAGNQPYSVRIGNTWYAYHRLGPLAMVMGVAADMHDVGAEMQQKDIGHVGNLLVSSLAKSLLDESFMRGPAELLQAIEDSDRYGARYVQNQLSTLIPFSTGMAQVARAADPYAREARTLMDTIKSKVPGLSETLMPRRDIWGQPMPNATDLGFDGLTSIAEKRAGSDPVNQTMLNLNLFPSMPERKLVGVQLTDKQYDDYARVGGQMAKMRLNALIGTPGFSALPEGAQTKVITQTMEASRRAAGELVKMQNPQIIQQAVANKRAFLQEGRAALAH
jgi:hypothetical protein